MHYLSYSLNGNYEMAYSDRAYLGTQEPSAAGLVESKKFDISKIDFDLLRREFERVRNKNLLLKDLQILVEQRLAQMLKNNPLRIDYYQR